MLHMSAVRVGVSWLTISGAENSTDEAKRGVDSFNERSREVPKSMTLIRPRDNNIFSGYRKMKTLLCQRSYGHVTWHYVM